MNRSAQQHVAKAKAALAKGQEAYREAARAIIAARKADPALTLGEVDRQNEWPERYASKIVRWYESGADLARSPFYASSEKPETTDKRAVQRVLRNAPPEQVAEIIREADVERGFEISKAQNKAALKRQQEKEQRSAEKAREVLGDETVEGLEFTEAVQETGWYLIKANQDLAGFLKRANELGIENVPDRFRESWLDSLEGAEGKLGMARALIQADDIDWTAFEDMLGKEVN